MSPRTGRRAAEAERRGLVRIACVGGESLVAPAVPASVPASADWRLFIENKLKCPLLRAAVRERIYALTEETMAERPNEQPLALVDLSYRVARRVGGDATQPSIFKLLFALVLANVFVIARHARLHQIQVAKPAVPVAQWDRRFIASCLVGLRRGGCDLSVRQEALAAALDVPLQMLRDMEPQAS